MKKSVLLIGLTATIGLSSCDSMNQIQNTLPNVLTNSGVTQNEAASGIQEALIKGVVNGVTNLSKTNGFFGNDLYKLLLPTEVQNVTNTLKNIGLGSVVDNAVLKINRAAETAVSSATPIFTNAIKQMTITDAVQLVKGGDGSITNFFRQKCTAQLISSFSPTIKNALDQNSATKYYSQLITAYNGLPLSSKKLNPDLTNYVATGAVNALFDQVSKEETNIRQNPIERTSDILKKVFGGNIK